MNFENNDELKDVLNGINMELKNKNQICYNKKRPFLPIGSPYTFLAKPIGYRHI